LEQSKLATKDSIISKQYFQDAMKWYNGKFLFPVIERSLILFISIILALLGLIMLIQIQSQFPLKKEITYLSFIDQDILSQNTNIEIAPEEDNNPTRYINEHLCKFYILKREKYDYYNLKEQLIYLKSTSSKKIFRSFYNSLNLSNPESPLVRYQKYAKRYSKIENIQFLDDNHIIANLNIEIRDNDFKLLEKKKAKITMSFDSDSVNKYTNNQKEFYFIVTEYNIQNVVESV
jgi:type IV secretion system protein VirB8